MNGDELPKPYGFTLLIFDLNSTVGRMNYLSNAHRDDMVRALKEFIANVEAEDIIRSDQTIG